MKFKSLDLNLLVALDALLENRSVSGAARQLFLTQPSMSSALARLREHFHDELLVPLGRKMVLTAFAETLVQPVRSLMIQIEATVERSSGFDPKTANRKFIINASDHMAEIVLERVAIQAAQSAPGIVIEITPMFDDPVHALEIGEIDFMIVPDSRCSKDHPADLLYEEQHVITGWSGNPLLSRPPTQKRFLEMGHIVVRTGRDRTPSIAEIELNNITKNWRIELIASSYTAVPGLLVGTNRIALLQRRLAERAARELPLTIQPLPFPFPGVNEVLQYHRVRSQDDGIQWLRQLILRCTSEVV